MAKKVKKEWIVIHHKAEKMLGVCHTSDFNEDDARVEKIGKAHVDHESAHAAMKKHAGENPETHIQECHQKESETAVESPDDESDED